MSPTNQNLMRGSHIFTRISSMSAWRNMSINPFETLSLQSVLVDNDTLAEAGVEFTPVHEINSDYDDGDFAYAESTYPVSGVIHQVRSQPIMGSKRLRRLLHLLLMKWQ